MRSTCGAEAEPEVSSGQISKATCICRFLFYLLVCVMVTLTGSLCNNLVAVHLKSVHFFGMYIMLL